MKLGWPSPVDASLTIKKYDGCKELSATLTSNGDLAGNFIFKVNNRKTRLRCKICLKLTIKTSERRQWRLSGVFIVNFEHI